MVNVIDWLITTLEAWGYLGIFILMALESMVVPIPAEVVLIPAGYLIFKGSMSWVYLIVFSILGSLAGSLLSYYLAYKIGRSGFEKLGKKYPGIPFWNQKHLKSSENFFRKNGHVAIFTSRFIPGLRHVISLPAGFSKMNLIEFSIYTTLGAGAYNLFLIFLGYFAGTNQGYLESHITLMVGAIAVIFIVGFLVYRIVITRRQKHF